MIAASWTRTPVIEEDGIQMERGQALVEDAPCIEVVEGSHLQLHWPHHRRCCLRAGGPESQR